MTNPRYVSTAVYAEAAGVTERTVRDRIDRGELEATQGAAGAPWRIPWAVYKVVAPDEPVAPESPSKHTDGGEMETINFPVLKAFVIDLATTAVTLAVTWMTIPDNLSQAGVSDFVAPVVAALAGAALVALRRYNIVKNS